MMNQELRSGPRLQGFYSSPAGHTSYSPSYSPSSNQSPVNPRLRRAYSVITSPYSAAAAKTGGKSPTSHVLLTRDEHVQHTIFCRIGQQLHSYLTPYMTGRVLHHHHHPRLSFSSSTYACSGLFGNSIIERCFDKWSRLGKV